MWMLTTSATRRIDYRGLLFLNWTSVRGVCRVGESLASHNCHIGRQIISWITADEKRFDRWGVQLPSGDRHRPARQACNWVKSEELSVGLGPLLPVCSWLAAHALYTRWWDAARLDSVRKTPWNHLERGEPVGAMSVQIHTVKSDF